VVLDTKSLQQKVGFQVAASDVACQIEMEGNNFLINKEK